MKLEPMTQEKFEQYLKTAIPHLGKEISQSRNISEKDGLEISRNSFANLFPEMKVSSPDQYVFELLDGENIIGFLHLGIRRDGGKPFGFIWDFEVYSEFRGRGLGKTALDLCEDELSKMGISRVGLNVFDHNRSAICLYEKAGYLKSSIVMFKHINAVQTTSIF